MLTLELDSPSKFIDVISSKIFLDLLQKSKVLISLLSSILVRSFSLKISLVDLSRLGESTLVLSESEYLVRSFDLQGL